MMVRNVITGYGFNPQPPEEYVGESGSLSWNGRSQKFDVFNGDISRSVYGDTVSIEFDSNVLAVIAWAQKKMAEEREIQYLIDTHPGLKEAKLTYDVMLNLCKDWKK